MPPGASGTQKFSGDITGDGSVDWLMAYRPDGTAEYVGMQRITGKIGKRKGSIVLAAWGEYIGKTSRAIWTIVRGLGTGDLKRMRGSGMFKAGPGAKATYEIYYRLK